MSPVLGPYSDGPDRLVLVFPVSVKDPDEALHRVCKKAYGVSYKVILPRDEPEAYESAYDVVTQNLTEGSSFSVIDRNSGRSTFFTPKGKERAWSGWVRVVDIGRFLYN